MHTRLIALEPLRLALPREHPAGSASGGSGWPTWPRSRSSACGRPPRCGRLTDDLCEQAGFRPDVIFEGDDLSNVRGFVAAGLGVAVVPAPRAGSPEAAPGPVAYRELADPGAVREIFLNLVRRAPPAPRHRPVPQARHPPGRRGQAPGRLGMRLRS